MAGRKARRAAHRMGSSALILALVSAALTLGAAIFTAPNPAGAATNGVWSLNQTFPPVVPTLNSVSCPSSSTCEAVGSFADNSAAIVGSTNGGATWVDQVALSAYSSVDLAAVACPSATVCEAVGNSSGSSSISAGGVILGTNDGGTSWSLQSVPTGTGDLTAIACPSTSTCIAGAADVVIGTSNGGATWSTLSNRTGATLLASIACPSVHVCVEVGTGVPGEGVIEVTANGGSTWADEEYPGINETGGASELTGVSCSSTSSCEAIGYNANNADLGAILTTVNGGTTWTTQVVPSTFGHPAAVACSSTADCEVVGQLYPGGAENGSTAIVTSNGGATWATQSLPAGPFPLAGLSCPSTTDCVAVGGSPSSTDAATGATIVETTNGGASWTAAAPPSGVDGVTSTVCPSALVCYAVGQGSSGTSVGGIVISTQDGGSSWDLTGLPNGLQRPLSISCPSTANCVAVGTGPAGWAVATSDNAGASWVVPIQPPLGAASNASTYLLGVSCGSTSVCDAVGYAYNSATGYTGYIFGTADGGTTWDLEDSSVSLGAVTSVACVSETCYALASDALLVSTDGGVTWTAKSGDFGVAGYPVTGLACPTSTTCDAVFLDGVATTTNGGATWSTYQNSQAVGLNAIDCVSVNTCEAVGSYSPGGPDFDLAYGTTNDWASMFSQTVSSVEGLDAVACGSFSSCFAFGGNTTNGAWVLSTALPPSISSVSSSYGSSAGGSAVTITGENLSGATAVDFGSAPATTFTVESAGQITATVPASSSNTSVTTVAITVTSATGTSLTNPAVEFTYYPVPTVTEVGPNAGSIKGMEQVYVIGTAFAPDSTVSFGGIPASSVSVFGPTEISAIAPPGSPGVVDVTVTTESGTSATSPLDQFDYVVTPTVTGVAPSGGPNTGGTVVTISGSGFDGDPVTDAVLFGGASAQFNVVSDTEITAVAPPVASLGSVDVTVESAGGSSTISSADVFTYGAGLPPTVASLTVSGGPGAGGTEVGVTGQNFLGTTGVAFGGRPATSFTAVSPTQLEVVSPPGSAPNTVDVTVTTVNGTSATSTADQFAYVPVPTVTSVSPGVGPGSGGTTMTITGANFTAVDYVSFGTLPDYNFTVESPTTMTVTTPSSPARTVDVTVTAIGGTSATSSVDQYIFVAAPIVSAVSPAAGLTTGGTAVTITGSNFTGATAVSFGGMPASSFSVSSNSGSSISATAPAGSGTVDVIVTTIGGTSATSAADHFTYVAAAPAVSAVSPDTGPISGGTTVTITGSNFTSFSGNGAVYFGSSIATSYRVLSASSITAISPAESAGAVDVTVSMLGLTSVPSSANQFTFIGPPVVTSVSPSQGPYAGGTTVTITGSNFTGATAVSFGGTPATSFTVTSASSISAISPAGTGMADVTITTSSGYSALSVADRFTYIGPSVSKVNPATVSTGGGTTVTITGAGFAGVTAVDIGAARASSFKVMSSSTITAVTPAEPAGTVDVTVTTGVGTSEVVSRDRLTYVVPSVTRLSPATGAANRSTPVTLTGVVLNRATTVHFGSQPAVSFTLRSATSITAVAPPQPAGPVPVTVTTPAGVTAVTPDDTFTYEPSAVTKVTPTSGTVAGDTPVLITGKLLTGATAVSFGGVPASSFTVASSTSIRAVSPPGSAGTVDIVVTAPAGTSAVVTADHFTYVVPAVTRVSPVSGRTAGGTTVTITGVLLHGATAVMFGTTPATSFTVVSPTSITAVSPPGVVGPVDIRVTTTAGQTATSSADRFTYLS